MPMCFAAKPLPDMDLRLLPRAGSSARRRCQKSADRRRNPVSIQDFGVGEDIQRRAVKKCQNGRISLQPPRDHRIRASNPSNE